MSSPDQIKRFLKNTKINTVPDTNQEVLNELFSELDRAKTLTPVKQPNIWRIIMKNPMTKIATAAAVILIAVLGITFLDKSVPSAYALEQTIQASHTVRYLHIKTVVLSQDEPGQSWVEFDARGQVKKVRMDLPEWAGGGDGPKVIVWKEDKAQVWLKRKKSLVTIGDKTIADQYLKLVQQCDPKLALKGLNEQQEQDKVEVEIVEPSNKSEPIIITATNIEQDDEPFQRIVLLIDQATRLVNAFELYKLEDDEYQHVMTVEYYDYNQPIASEMFTLDDVPDDVMRIDQTTQEIGLLQGDLTDKEIAVEVVRQFYQALIDKDYAKAGQLFEGVPAAKIQEWFEELNVISIVSIGEPTPHPTPGVGGFRVPCKIEFEKNGVTSIFEPYGPGVRPVHGQPDRWDIHGGVN